MCWLIREDDALHYHRQFYLNPKFLQIPWTALNLCQTFEVYSIFSLIKLSTKPLKKKRFILNFFDSLYWNIHSNKACVPITKMRSSFTPWIVRETEIPDHITRLALLILCLTFFPKTPFSISDRVTNHITNRFYRFQFTFSFVWFSRVTISTWSSSVPTPSSPWPPVRFSTR